MNTNLTRLAGAAFCAALSAVSFGQLALAPGGAIALPQTPYASELNYIFNVGANPTYISDNFSGLNAQNQVVFTGTLYEGVWQDTQTNGLDFFFEVYNDPTSPDAISDLTFTHFAGVNTSVLQYIDGNAAAAFATRDITGDTMGFSYLNFGGGLNPIAPGTWSDTVGIFTNAKTYTVGSAQIQDGGNVTVPILAPMATPEPCSMAALAMGGIALVRRRRKNA